MHEKLVKDIVSRGKIKKQNPTIQDLAAAHEIDLSVKQLSYFEQLHLLLQYFQLCLIL